MAWPPELGGFWSPPGARAGATRWRFQGAEGLARLTGIQTITAPDPAAFDAELVRLRLDHVALERFTASPHVVQRSAAEQRAHPASLVTVVSLLRGRLDVVVPTGSWSVRPGEHCVVDTRLRTRVEAPEPVEMLRSVVALEHVPEGLREEAVSVRLQPTPLVRGFAAFVESVFAATDRGRSALLGELVPVVVELHAAVLAEAHAVLAWPTGPAALRQRIGEAIDRRYPDPGLTPGAIAAELQVDEERVEAAFPELPGGVAAAIAERRLSAAATRLRVDPGPVDLARIARDAGFADEVALERAFVQRFGATPAEYRSGGHRVVD